MSLQTAIYTLLSSDALLTDLVGPRLAPVRSDAAHGYPRVTWLEIPGQPQNSLGGWSGVDHVRLQIDCYALTQAYALAVKSRVRAVMSAGCAEFTANCITDADGPVEAGLEIYRRLLEFSIWTR